MERGDLIIEQDCFVTAFLAMTLKKALPVRLYSQPIRQLFLSIST